MLTFTVDDSKIDNIAKMYSEFQDVFYPICSEGLYEGAKIAADALKPGIPFRTGGLQSSMGISRFSKDTEGPKTKVGFDGYNTEGRPYPVIARSLAKHSKSGGFGGVSSAVGRAEQAITSFIEHEFEEFLNKQN